MLFYKYKANYHFNLTKIIGKKEGLFHIGGIIKFKKD